jgi:hypothetical protein
MVLSTTNVGAFGSCCGNTNMLTMEMVVYFAPVRSKFSPETSVSVLLQYISAKMMYLVILGCFGGFWGVYLATRRRSFLFLCVS